VLDLLDQELDRAPGCSHFVAIVACEALSPAAEHVDSLFVETRHHTPDRPRWRV
jgi:hypothetical protein